MAITKLTYPAAGTPLENADYTRQNALTYASIVQGLDGWKLSGWNNVDIPSFKQGTYLRHQNCVYVVDTADYTIQGTTPGIRSYVKLSGSGDTITATWIQDISGYSYNPSLCGVYNSNGDQILTEYTYKTYAGQYLNCKAEFNMHQEIDSLDEQAFSYISWELSGAGFSVTRDMEGSIAVLNSTDIAMVTTSSGSKVIGLYRFNGSSWSLMGTALVLTTSGGVFITALDSTSIAVAREESDSNVVNVYLQKYILSGYTFTAQGSALTIPVSSDGDRMALSISAMSTSSIAFIDNNNQVLRKYVFNGTDWSIVGSGLSLGGTMLQLTQIASMSSSLVAVSHSPGDGSMYVGAYYFNGSTWSLVGSKLATNTTSTFINSGIAYMAYDQTLAYIDLSCQLRLLRFNGSSWSDLGVNLSIDNTDDWHNMYIGALTSHDIALVEGGNISQLRTYALNISV